MKRQFIEGRLAMGVERALSWNELKEGFPPAYTWHIGVQAMQWLLMRRGLLQAGA